MLGFGVFRQYYFGGEVVLELPEVAGGDGGQFLLLRESVEGGGDVDHFHLFMEIRNGGRTVVFLVFCFVFVDLFLFYGLL